MTATTGPVGPRTARAVASVPRRGGKRRALELAELLLERQNRQTGMRWRFTVAPAGGVHVTELSGGSQVWEPSLAAAFAWTDYLVAAQRHGAGPAASAALTRYLLTSASPRKV